MAKEKKIPMRMCLCCREMKQKRELVRVVMNKEGICSLDLTGKAPGRGAYLCKEASCAARLEKSKALDRAFGRSVPEEVYRQLREELAKS